MLLQNTKIIALSLMYYRTFLTTLRLLLVGKLFLFAVACVTEAGLVSCIVRDDSMSTALSSHSSSLPSPPFPSSLLQALNPFVEQLAPFFASTDSTTRRLSSSNSPDKNIHIVNYQVSLSNCSFSLSVSSCFSECNRTGARCSERARLQTSTDPAFSAASKT